MNSLVRRAVVNYSVRNRTRKARAITGWMADRDVRTVAFIGCSPGRGPNEQIVERAIADAATVLWACDVLPCPDAPWPFRLEDARDLSAPDSSLDMLLANAVIEHVGVESDQRRMVAEMCRVADNWVITTPNRWFPIESHTSAVLRHWSPKWREQRREFTRLLSLGEFRKLLPADTVITGTPASPTFTAYWPGIPR